MSKLTNNQFKATLHRVKMSNEERFSIPFFTELAYNTNLKRTSLYESDYFNSNPELNMANT